MVSLIFYRFKFFLLLCLVSLQPPKLKAGLNEDLVFMFLFLYIKAYCYCSASVTFVFVCNWKYAMSAPVWCSQENQRISVCMCECVSVTFDRFCCFWTSCFLTWPGPVQVQLCRFIRLQYLKLDKQPSTASCKSFLFFFFFLNIEVDGCWSHLSGWLTSCCTFTGMEVRRCSIGIFC